eukprot:335033_1
MAGTRLITQLCFIIPAVGLWLVAWFQRQLPRAPILSADIEDAASYTPQPVPVSLRLVLLLGNGKCRPAKNLLDELSGKGGIRRSLSELEKTIIDKRIKTVRIATIELESSPKLSQPAEWDKPGEKSNNDDPSLYTFYVGCQQKQNDGGGSAVFTIGPHRSSVLLFPSGQQYHNKPIRFQEVARTLIQKMLAPPIILADLHVKL